MNDFKLSKKKIHNDTRSTIEEVHDTKMKEILNEISNLDSKKKRLTKLEQYYDVLCNNHSSKTEQLKVHNNIQELKYEISNIESNYDAMDYICKAWEFIENIEDLDKLNESSLNTNTTKYSSYSNENENENESENESENENENENEDLIENNKSENNKSENNKSENNKSGILKYINQKGQSKKGQIYNDYMNKCFKNIVIDKDNSNKCKNCNNTNFTFDSGQKICIHCGCCENYIDTSINSINYNDIILIEPSAQTFSYQRKNHFKEWLNQLQAKEVTNIPDTVINLLLIEIKKERITEMDKINSERIKKYLKKLKLNKYYEHIPNIISKITNSPQLKITPEFEKILLNLFDLIQEPFQKHCPENRKNFLSYSYTLHKFCQILNKTEYLIYFPLLKSREKLFEQEKIWRNICKELNWEFKASI